MRFYEIQLGQKVKTRGEIMAVELAVVSSACWREFQFGGLSVCWCHSLLNFPVQTGDVKGVYLAALGFDGVVDGAKA